MIVRKRIIAVAPVMLCASLLAGCTSGSSGESAHRGDQPGRSPAASPSHQLPLAVPNAAGPQPAQVDPNKFLPDGDVCDAFRESGALNLASPLKDIRSYEVQLVNGGWCVFGPKGVTRGAPMFAILYEDRKVNSQRRHRSQVSINHADALIYSQELYERNFGSTKGWKAEKVWSSTTLPAFTTLVSNGSSSKFRRYYDVIVTTQSEPHMTMLIHFQDPLSRQEASHLVAGAAASAYRAGVRLSD